MENIHMDQVSFEIYAKMGLMNEYNSVLSNRVAQFILLHH